MFQENDDKEVENGTWIFNVWLKFTSLLTDSWTFPCTIQFSSWLFSLLVCTPTHECYIISLVKFETLAKENDKSLLIVLGCVIIFC